MHSSSRKRARAAHSLSLCVKRGAAAAFFCAFGTVAHFNLRFQSATSESRSKYHLQEEFRAASLVCVRGGGHFACRFFCLYIWSMRKGSERPAPLQSNGVEDALAKVDLDKVADLCLRMVRKFQAAKAHFGFCLNGLCSLVFLLGFDLGPSHRGCFQHREIKMLFLAKPFNSVLSLL